MKHNLTRYSSIVAALAFVAVFFGAAIFNTPNTEAISATDFKAGNIIDDGVFYNKNTMTVADIQAHMNKYMPACDTWGTGAIGSGRYINGKAVPANTTRAEYAKKMRAAGKSRYHDPPYICVQNYYENPSTHQNLYDTKNVKKDGMISSAQIIYNASQKYGINPQVLLVLLKKESYVWGDNWPLRDEYNTVMGYACPDTAPCDSKYFGFYNQVEMAAWQLNYYKEHINSYNYRPYATNSILYSPDASCGRKSVYLENLATTSLYIYTPYTPNDAALRNYPGTATCGSYGNRNFFMYFSEWFGSTHKFNATKLNIPEGDYVITTDTSLPLRLVSEDITNGIKIIAADNSANATKVFNFKKSSSGDSSYVITNKSSGAVLDVPGGSAVVDAKIQQWAFNDTSAQKWYIYGDNSGGYYIASRANPAYVLSVNKNNEVVLDVYGSSSSKALKLISESSANNIPDDNYRIISALKAGFNVDLYGNSTANGTNISMYADNNTKAQVFKFNYEATTGSYKITANSGKVLDVSGGNMKNGTNINVWDSNNSCAQRFVIMKNNDANNYSIYSLCNINFSLDIYGANTKNGTNLQLWSANGSNAQRWIFESATKREAEEAAKKAAEEEAAKKAAEEAAKKKTEEAANPSTPATPAPTQTSQIIADGKYFIHSKLRSDLVLDIYGGSTKNGANIQVWNKNRSGAQIFSVKYDTAKNAYRFVNSQSNKSIDLYGSSQKSGANIWQYASNESCAQYWKIEKNSDGSYAIASSCNTSRVLDVSGASTKAGTNVQSYAENGTKAQKWTFEKL